MAGRKSKATTERGKDAGSTERANKSPPDRPRPPEPFEECGPSGGYGGAGTEKGGEKDD
jgi:hypothetical protein